MKRSGLFIGTVDSGGNVVSRPAVAEFDADGTLLHWHYLSGHEPHSTTFSPTLLQLPDEQALSL